MLSLLKEGCSESRVRWRGFDFEEEECEEGPTWEEEAEE